MHSFIKTLSPASHVLIVLSRMEKCNVNAQTAAWFNEWLFWWNDDGLDGWDGNNFFIMLVINY